MQISSKCPGSKCSPDTFYSYGTVRMADDFTDAGTLNPHVPVLFNATPQLKGNT